MVVQRRCSFRSTTGKPCRAAPLKDGEFCLMHSPEHAKEVQEARRLGGLRRKREVTVSGAYDFEGLETVAGIRRLVEVAVLDTLGAENSLARSRTLGYLAQVALHTLEVGDLENRLNNLEQAVHGQRITIVKSSFDQEPTLLEGSQEEPG